MVKRYIFCAVLLILCVAAFGILKPVSVEIDTFRVFTEDISRRIARENTLQFAREIALSKALPQELAISSLTTDMYVERNRSFDEQTARSIFMMSSSAGRFLSENIVDSKIKDDPRGHTFSYHLKYKAEIMPMPRVYNSELDLKVSASNTLLKDGESFDLEIKPTMDGYIYIFDFLPDNSVSLAFPTPQMKDNTLKANLPWRLNMGVKALPDRQISIETLYFVFSSTPISGWDIFKVQDIEQGLVFSAGEESFVLFQKWLGKSDPNKRVEKMLQLHIMRD